MEGVSWLKCGAVLGMHTYLRSEKLRTSRVKGHVRCTLIGMLEKMVRHPRRAAHENGSPKLWLLFFLGLVIVLVLFRAFAAAVEGMGGFRSGREAGSRVSVRKRRRREEDEPGRKGLRRIKVADGHSD